MYHILKFIDERKWTQSNHAPKERDKKWLMIVAGRRKMDKTVPQSASHPPNPKGTVTEKKVAE